MAIKSNKLVPVLVIVALVIISYVLYHRVSKPAATAAGPDLAMVPQPGVDPNAPPPKGRILGPNKLPAMTRPADADTSEETLITVTAANTRLRETAERQLAELEALRKEKGTLQAREDEIVARVAQKVAEQQAANPVVSIVDNGLAAAQQMASVATGGTAIPAGLGYDGLPPTSAGKVGTPVTPTAPPAGAALTKVIAPMGYSSATGDGTGTLKRKTLGVQDRSARDTDAMMAGLGSSDPTLSGTAGKGLLPEAPLPYFTIPENATLAKATAMTTIVGRVPIDGRVQDPMQFKLIVGRDNLAASGQFVPDDVSGVIVSGIAVGDMALSCSEGLIQSLTFVFDDGTIRTVSQRSNGVSAGFGAGGGDRSGGGVGSQSLASTSKLGWISDEFGNPCLPGKFVTNAPAYLTDLIMAKGFSIAGDAIAAAETTTTTGASALGSTASTSVTGNKGRYVMGRTAGAGSQELVDWLMKRLNNSFDAVVVRAGTRVAVHIDQSIAIDKDPSGRKLDYARGRSDLAQQTGVAHHGTD